VTLIVEPDPEVATTLAFALGEDVRRVDTLAGVQHDLDAHPGEVLVVVGPDADLGQALQLAWAWQIERPLVGMVLLRRRIDVQVLGEALRAGVREVVGPDDLAGVVEAARRSLEVSRRRRGAGADRDGDGPRQAHVITVFSAKGGCGKTTVSTNLAAAVALSGRSVCVLDLDLEFGDVAIAMQVAPERTIIDALPMAGTMDEHGVRSVVTTTDHGIDAVLAPVHPGDASKVPAAIVPELVGVLRGLYDVVVIDTPPAINEHVLAAFDLADTTVLLATLDVPALKNLKVSIDTLDMLGFPRESRVVVLNRADARVGLTSADVESTIGFPPGLQIPSSGDVPNAINHGRLIVHDQPEHDVSRAFRRLAGLIGVTSAEPDEAPRPGGLRSLLKRGSR